MGLLCCALGRPRGAPITDLTALTMAVRVDRPGTLLHDYHTVGAGIGCMKAAGGIKRTGTTGKIETFVTLRYYLSDASFLVALQGPAQLIERLAAAVRNPAWPPFLGRKSCPPSAPLYEAEGQYPDALTALAHRPWRARLPQVDGAPTTLRCIVECSPGELGAEPRSDFPLSFAPRRFALRFVRETAISPTRGAPIQTSPKPFARPRMNYRTRHWQGVRNGRSEADRYLCVFCGLPSSTVHHVTYERANEEDLGDLRSMCRMCHDAVTMIETERGMGAQRLDPLDPRHRMMILLRRDDILRNRCRPNAGRST